MSCRVFAFFRFSVSANTLLSPECSASRREYPHRRARLWSLPAALAVVDDPFDLSASARARALTESRGLDAHVAAVPTPWYTYRRSPVLDWNLITRAGIGIRIWRPKAESAPPLFIHFVFDKTFSKLSRSHVDPATTRDPLRSPGNFFLYKILRRINNRRGIERLLLF